MGRVGLTSLLPLRGPMACLFVFGFLSLFTYGETLLCYKCTNALTNAECNTDANIVDCADEAKGTSRLDTCQTRVFKTSENGIRYTKSCVQGPCTLGDNQDVALGLDPDCDRTRDSYDCDYCCDSDKCNTSEASIMNLTIWLLVAAGLVSLGYMAL